MRGHGLSDHALITFDFLLLDDLPSAKSVYTRHLSDQTVSQFKEEILSVFSSVPCLNVAVDPFSDVNSSPAQIDQIVECAAGSLRSTLDLIAPLKKKDLKPKKRAPWFNSQTRELKKTTQKLERKWRSSKLEEHRTAWLDGLSSYRRMLRRARASYYSTLIEENKNNHRFLFSTVARLTKSHSVNEPSIPVTLGSEEFMDFFNNKILLIRDKILAHNRKMDLEQDSVTLWRGARSVNIRQMDHTVQNVGRMFK
ncbi:uncharacterized protein V6R79_008612 [Siganus canaliculatus]